MNEAKTVPFYLCYDKQDEGCKEWLCKLVQRKNQWPSNIERKVSSEDK